MAAKKKKKATKKKSGKTKPVETIIGVFWDERDQAKGVPRKDFKLHFGSGAYGQTISRQTKKAWGKALSQDRKAKRTSNSWAKALDKSRNR